jgi:regulator of protease activity HflC (stomatin/prohibitin superfamily)
MNFPEQNKNKYLPFIMLGLVILFILGTRVILPLIIVGIFTYILINKILPQIKQEQQDNIIDLDNQAEENKNFNINNFIQNLFGQKTQSGFSQATNSGFIKNMNKKIGFIAIIIIAAVILIKSIIVIPAGFTGVYHLFGKVKDDELSSGLHLINPLALVEKMSIRTEEYTMSIAQGEGKKFGADAIDALTKEGLKVELDITVLYHLQEDKASTIFKELGVTYEEKLIRPQIRSSIREVIAEYEAKDIYSEKRQEAALKLLANLQEKINPRGIEIEEVLMRNVILPAKLEASIQEKLTAEQESQRYEFLLQKEEKEKQRKIIEAEGQRDAQKIINESLTARYLEYLYITGLKDRPGTIYVPTNPNNGLPMFKGIQ